MSDAFAELLATIHTLRAPGGCPWDRKQTLLSASRYLLDEAAELVEAAMRNDLRGVREELGDLLFMTCFCAEILGEHDDVDMQRIAAEGNAKLIRRHPHVFGEAEAEDTEASQRQWNAIKDQEKRERGEDPDAASILKDMPPATAPLHQAYRYQKDAATAGFDWPDLAGVRAKLDEELAELDEAIGQDDAAAVEHEIGDVLFAVVNIARRLGVQPDIAMRRVNGRFRERFHLVEEEFRTRGASLAEASLAEMEAAWQRAKRKLDSGTDA